MSIIIIILTFICLLHYISATDLAELPTATRDDTLVRRQLLAGCGLDLMIGGKVSPKKASGFANLCLQCRVNVFGICVGFTFFDALSANIGRYGICPIDAPILQSYIASDLVKIATKAKTSISCRTACSLDQRCASCTFVNGNCRMTAVNYVNQNRLGVPLAQAFQAIFLAGGSQYCALCPNDRSCGPKATQMGRRSSVSKDEMEIKCPSGLTACPLSPTSNFSTSTAYECLDVAEELVSCGGCTTLGEGKDCSALRGVSSSGCSNGKCKIFSCKSGFKYSKIHDSCYKVQHNSKSKAHN